MTVQASGVHVGPGFNSRHLHQPSQKVARRSLGEGGLLLHQYLSSSGYGWQAHCSILNVMWHYVYVLENVKGMQYVGLTEDVNMRLEKHNRGEVTSTGKYRPWMLRHFSAFPTRGEAARFELYLKSGSGREFRYRHLVQKLKSRSNHSHD